MIRVMLMIALVLAVTLPLWSQPAERGHHVSGGPTLAVPARAPPTTPRGDTLRTNMSGVGAPNTGTLTTDAPNIGVQRAGASAPEGSKPGTPPGARPLEEGIILFNVTGVATRELIVQFAGDSLLLPFDELCEFLQIRHSASAAEDTLTGEQPAGIPFTLTGSTATYRGERREISPDALRIVNGRAFVSLGLLADCFGVGMDFDVDQMAVTMEPAGRIPLVGAFMGSRRREALGYLNEDKTGYQSKREIRRELLGNLAIDWSVNNIWLNHGAGTTSGFFRLGGPLLFGVFSLDGSGSYVADNRSRTGFAINGWRWAFALPSFPLLRRIAISEVIAGPVHRYGLELSNAALGSRYRFGTYAVDGSTRPLWTVELYDRDELIQAAQADSIGAYRFDVPIGYAPLGLTVVQIGPYGERIVDASRVEVHTAQLPPGLVEYYARASVEGFDRGAPIDGTTHIRAGIANWLTLGVDADLLPGPIAALSLDSVVPTFMAQTWLGGSTHLGVRYTPHRHSFGAEFDHTLLGDASLRLFVDDFSPVRRTLDASGFIDAPFGAVTFGLLSYFRRHGDSWALNTTPQAAWYMTDMSVTVASSFEWGHIDSTAPGEGAGVPTSDGGGRTALSVSGNIQRDLYVQSRFAVAHSSGRIDAMNLAAAYSILPEVRLGVSYDVDSMQWGAGQLGTQASISLFDRDVLLSLSYLAPVRSMEKGTMRMDLGLNLGFGRLRNLTTSNEGQIVSASFVNGGLLLSPSGIEPRGDAVVGRSSVMVRAFRDDNGNGRWDAGEEALGPLGATLNYRNMQTAGADGRFFGVAEDEEYAVEVDRWAFADSEIFPRRTTYDIYAVSSTVHVIDVPFAPGFDVGGTCAVILSDGRNGGGMYTSLFNGLRARLSSADGISEYDGEVFSDGELTFSGVSAGTYTLSFDVRQLDERGVRPAVPAVPLVVDATRRTLPPVGFVLHSTTTAPD